MTRIGTRGSLLALAQTTLVAEALAVRLGVPVVRHVVTTSGDRKQREPDGRVSDKREWVDALEHALIRGEVDVALHSGKDVPVDVLSGTELVPVLPRETPRDCFVGRRMANGDRLRLDELSAGSVIGTASARRAAQLMRLGYAVRPWRGNVPTRVRRLDEQEEVSGIVIAAAGVRRLRATSAEVLRLDEVVNFDAERATALHAQLAELATLDVAQAHEFDPAQLLPATNQGTLVAQVRSDRRDLRAALEALSESATAATFWAERTAIALLGADCESAAAVYGQASERGITLRARVLDPQGTTSLDEEHHGNDPYTLAATLADALNAAGAQQLLHPTP